MATRETGFYVVSVQYHPPKAGHDVAAVPVST